MGYAMNETENTHTFLARSWATDDEFLNTKCRREVKCLLRQTISNAGIDTYIKAIAELVEKAYSDHLYDKVFGWSIDPKRRKRPGFSWADHRDRGEQLGGPPFPFTGWMLLDIVHAHLEAVDFKAVSMACIDNAEKIGIDSWIDDLTVEEKAG